jgi:hypothetical protein
MKPPSQELLHTIAADLARLPVEAADLPSIAAQLGAQLDGLARLDEFDLLTVEPATVLLPPTEADHAR